MAAAVGVAGRHGRSGRAVPHGSDPGGSQVCLVCAGERVGQVVFWEMEFEANTDEGDEVGWGNVYRVADSLGDFFRSLNLDEG